MFGVERNVVQVAAVHGVADVSFDERAGEEREELAQQERFDAVGLLEVDGRDGLVVFEDVVSAFEVGLVAVRGEDLGVGEEGHNDDRWDT